MIKQKYGVVYTPGSLSQFVATLLKRVADEEKKKIDVIIDPASGECSLLRAARSLFGANRQYIGIDIDIDAVNETKDICMSLQKQCH